MKIYSLFNSSKQLLATFTNKDELGRFVTRNARDAGDTTILTTVANDWGEFESPRNDTETLMHEIWTG